MCLCLGFDQRVVVDVCSGDDFFLNGFASAMIFFNGFFFLNGFEWVCSGDDFFDRWPGFQIGGVGF